MLSFQPATNIEITETFCFFSPLVLSLWHVLGIAHVNLNTKSSLKTLDLYLDFMIFTAEEAESHSQVVPNMLKDFPVTELSIHF